MRRKTQNWLQKALETAKKPKLAFKRAGKMIFKRIFGSLTVTKLFWSKFCLFPPFSALFWGNFGFRIVSEVSNCEFCYLSLFSTLFKTNFNFSLPSQHFFKVNFAFPTVPKVYNSEFRHFFLFSAFFKANFGPPLSPDLYKNRFAVIFPSRIIFLQKKAKNLLPNFFLP